MKKLLIFLVLFSSCGPAYPLRDKIDPEFIPYVETFESYYGKKVDVGIYFVDNLEGDTVGISHMYSDKEYNYIEIEKIYWDTAIENNRENVIFHELGHAELLRQHNKTLDENGWPVSIMYPYVIDDWIYQIKRDSLIQELFQ